MKKKNQLWLITLAIVAIASLIFRNANAQTGYSCDHFDAKGNQPSEFTIEKWDELRNTLPFEDSLDFEEQKRGFIASPEYREIMADEGHVAWSMSKYDFLFDDEEYKSIHPSLQRQAVLNMNYGLFEVIPGIYQVRGFDLANITFIKGETGWIVFDPLTSTETARGALELVNEHLGERPIVAVIYSHSHGDHWAGVRGLGISDEDVASGKIKVIAPEGFMEHALMENVHAGNAMNRRMMLQYSVLTPASPYGLVDQAIGKSVSAGEVGLIAPNVYVSEDIEEITVDGVKMVFQNTPGTEAPCEMNTYFPDMKAFWAAENVVGTIHNIYTVRGALVRDALEWSRQINNALYLFGHEAEVMFASHSWPRWGNERIQEVLKDQRDTYAHLNNGVLHLANQGVTINEIHNEYEVPESLQDKWQVRSYHGDVKNNSRAVINRYLGHWDGNPATIIPLSPYESAPLFVEMMGGAEPIMKKGKELYDKGEYLSAIEILDKLAYAEIDNQEAKDLLADCYEQVGYQQESTSIRNVFIAGAHELRNGVPQGAATTSADSPDLYKAMETGIFLEFLAIRLDSKKVEGKEFTMNIATPDNGEEYILELRNGTLTNIEGYQAENADLTLTLDRAELDKVLMGETTLPELIESGIAKAEGDLGVLQTLAAGMVQFELRFEILPGTGSQEENVQKESLEYEIPEVIRSCD